MWVPGVLVYGILGAVLSQKSNADNVGHTTPQWGWQMRHTGPGTVGQYYVKLPQAEQRVRYIADGSGYHGAVAVTTNDQDHVHTTNFALGDRALQLSNTQLPTQIYGQPVAPNASQESLNVNRDQKLTPVGIFLLKGQYPSQDNFFEIISSNPVHVTPEPNLYFTDNVPPTSSYYRLNVKYAAPENDKISDNEGEIESSYKSKYNNNEIIETKESGPVVQVFKDHKCTHDDFSDDSNLHNHNENNFKKTTDTDEPIYRESRIHGNFGARDYTKFPRNQQQTNYKSDRSSSLKNENYHYSIKISHSPTKKPVSFTEDEGISKLVASTQDLISNEDLLRINHAAERIINGNGDDIIKPKRKFSSRTINIYPNKSFDRSQNKITVSAKIGNIINSNFEQPQDNGRGQSYHTTDTEYKFESPIIVVDPNYTNYKQPIVNNLVSTMVPNLQEGYKIIETRNNLEKSNTDSNVENKLGEDLVHITPRPVSQNYLAPIIVALRLLNANSSDILNTIEDHETSDSELIEKTVEHPEKGKTIVEIQESIPVEITHINDVEYHEYLNEGRSNNVIPFGPVKSIYQKYLQSLEASRNLQNHYDINTKDLNSEYDDERNNNDNPKETLESSENIQSEVQVHAISGNENSYSVDRPVPLPNHYETIVEKPIEVTKYIDKPYPVEVLQPFPVEVRVPYPVEHKVYIDRPVQVPYPIEKIIEKQFIQQVPVLTPVGIPIEIHVPVEKKVLYPVPVENPVPVPIPVEKPVPVEKIVEKQVPVPYPVEKQIPYPVHHEVKVPVPYPVEKRIPVPVEKIIAKPVTVTRVVEKPIHIKVPVPRPVPIPVHVPKPYPVERIIEKKIPYPVPVQRIIERRVPVQVPYPVKTVVEKIIEKPVVVTKYIDKPYPVEKRVLYPVEKIVERKVPYPVHIPIEAKMAYPVGQDIKRPDNPYPFEKVEKQTIYTYGINQDALANVDDYLKYNQEQYQQALPKYVQNDIGYSSQQHAESQRNYQIQLANAQILRNMQNVTPVYTTQGGNQYASSYHYINSSVDDKNLSLFNSLQGNELKYHGPPPLKNYNDQWVKNTDYTERVRRTDRTPKVTNLRIEYGGFKPPLIPSTEVDLDGIPVNKGHS